MSFQAYLDNAERRSGLTPQEIVDLAHARGFGAETPAAPVLAWLAEDLGIGRGHGGLGGRLRRRRLDGGRSRGLRGDGPRIARHVVDQPGRDRETGSDRQRRTGGTRWNRGHAPSFQSRASVPPGWRVGPGPASHEIDINPD